jgi:hypothetical protein
LELAQNGGYFTKNVSFRFGHFQRKLVGFLQKHQKLYFPKKHNFARKVKIEKRAFASKWATRTEVCISLVLVQEV